MPNNSTPLLNIWLNHLSSSADSGNMHDLRHPVLYEINTRVWLRQFDANGIKATLKNVPLEYWSALKEKGVDYVWLMGVWAASEVGIERNIFSEGTMDYYRSILSDLSEEDIIGSPYAIDTYRLNPALGKLEDLIEVRKNLHSLGLKLILDFVPNHFGKNSRLIEQRPELFLKGSQEHLDYYPELFFKSEGTNGQIFAHGKDLYSGAWRDTVQVDFSKQATRQFIADELLRVSKLCDGVRCDMAMIVIKRLFQQSWGELLPIGGLAQWNEPFWTETIQQVKNIHPDFKFIAECYWHTETEMLSYGFDFVYDKEFLDKIKSQNIQEIKVHLNKDPRYLSRGVFFLENHDEERAASFFEPYKLMAYSTLIATSPGMCFYYDGQWSGKRVRIPVQLGREPTESKCNCAIRPLLNNDPETICSCLEAFHNRLLKICATDIFKRGNWEVLDLPNEHIIGFLWTLEQEKKWVFINLGGIKANLSFEPSFFHATRMYDELNQQQVVASETDQHIQFDLFPYQSVILAVPS